MKRIFILFLALNLSACAELQEVVSQLPDSTPGISNLEIASGLREALDNGIDKQVSKLTLKDGFFKNELVKILLPEELKKVDKALRDIGLGNLADEGLKVLNRAAEDAVSEATPIFVNAITSMSFDDARKILFGEDDAATRYLDNSSRSALYDAFLPAIQGALDEVNARTYWKSVVEKYNSLPFVKKVNPKLDDHVNNKALDGMFGLIEVKEEGIRKDVDQRTSPLLKDVFSKLD